MSRCAARARSAFRSAARASVAALVALRSNVIGGRARLQILVTVEVDMPTSRAIALRLIPSRARFLTLARVLASAGCRFEVLVVLFFGVVFPLLRVLCLLLPLVVSPLAMSFVLHICAAPGYVTP